MTIISNQIRTADLTQQSPIYDHRTAVTFFRLPTLIILSGLLIAALSISMNEVEWRIAQSESNLVKFLPLLIIVFAAIIAIPVLPVQHVVPTLLQTLRINGFLTAYTFLAVVGSTYARFVLKQETSYFTQAIMSVSFYGAYFVFSIVPDEAWPTVMKWLLRTFWCAAAFATAKVLENAYTFLILKEDFPRSNHDLSFLLAITLILALYFEAKGKRIFAFFFITIITVLTLKNTAILFIFSTIGLFFLLPSPKKQGKLIMLILGGLFVIPITILVYLQLSPHISDGNTHFREYLFQYGIREFFQSPLYGQLFTGETATHFSTSIHSTLQLDVPIHNDWLEVLVQGGVIGFMLFAGTFIFLLYKLYTVRNQALANLDTPKLIFTTWVIALVVNHMLTMVINPVLASSDIACISWVAIAFAHRTINVFRPTFSYSW